MRLSLQVVTPDEEDPLQRRRKLVGLGLVLGMVLGTPGMAVAQAPADPAGRPDPAARPAAPLRTGAGNSGPATVTLLTGDRVTVSGSQASVRPAPGREDVRFQTRRDRGHLSVVPEDAVAPIRDGRVDRRLFDVTELVAAGYDDARRDNLPLLITGSNGAARRSAVPGGVTVTRELSAVGGFATTASKRRAAEVWAAVTAAGTKVGAAGGADRIWLDGRRQLTLDRSVPQIGAPEAYRAGFTGRGVRVAVLDTGVDATHPDLAGRVAQVRNFTEESAPGDVVGHGTHVASTIAGSGAASGGRHSGVAPDATLLDGKVCETYGCSESAILAGMQWAAVEQRANVINLSLGGFDTPEVDPLEEAVNTLTAQTGALFVISAGNSGRFAPVSSPSTADAALSVGAVDRDDTLAGFSSRGPRTGDDALKPDITAPGVGIVAARSRDGVIGEPAGDGYVAMSGTSMAAPHVSGAAALLAQKHTGWKADRLKALLMSSAKPHAELTAYEQGAGRVDLAKAVWQTVTSDPPSVSFGRALWPHGDDVPITRTVTWRNDGSTAINLDLAVETTGPGGRPAPAGMFTLGATRITVPGGGTASTTVTADTRVDSPDGHYTGRLVARSDNTAVAITPLAVHREVESYTVTARHLNRSGAVTGQHRTTLVSLDGLDPYDLYDPDGTAELRVPKGRYGLVSYVDELDGDEFVGTTQLVQPELVVAGDTRITLDARRGKPVRMTVPQRSATPALVVTEANFLAGESSYGFGLLAFDFTGLYTGGLGRAVSGERFFATVSSQWADLEVASSPYLYALSEAVPGRMPTGFVRHYPARDLATVNHRFNGGSPGLVTQRLVFPHRDPDIGGWAVGLPTATPGQRVEHYNTRGVRWSSELDFGVPTDDGWLDLKAILFSEERSLRAGRHYRESWNSAPYGPSFPAAGITRQGDRVEVNLPLHSDAEGHAGGSVADTARTVLYRNGVLVGEEPAPGYGEFDVPPGAADYRLETSSKRSFTDLSTEVSATWTFRSGHVAGDEPAALPASAIRFAPRLDRDNAAPAGRSFVIPVTVQRQPGAPSARVAALTVDVSYDGGKTWQQARVRPGGQGWAATVQHPAGTGHVSLRATARDTAGNTVTQRVIQAYRLR
ncbi:S8 family serine peptidase [Micromonospora peucetia]|uniref:S8 family serine peptidase n=1 Tax=Micromonospora peucetia TaxID=47871 RepID=UPI0022507452|nr:S8 family serine peptidase [Micromonospora peucetia]MCX4389615.1 S8 family serine peptidase [Micromonospora peucetia]